MLENNVVLVSGGTSGIGRAIVTHLCNESYKVIVLGKNKEKLKSILSDTNNKVECYQIDLNNLDDIKNVYIDIKKKFKKIDILINVAGIGYFGPITELDTSKVIECINVNLTATILLTNLVAKDMKLNNSGQIINMESIASTKGFKYGAPYVASKFGLAGYSEVLWQELKEYNIKVASIRPGYVNTQFLGECCKNYNMSSVLSLDDIIHAIMCVINQSETSNISDITLRPLKKEGQNLFINILKELYSNEK